MFEQTTRILTADKVIESVEYGTVTGFYIGLVDAVVPISGQSLKVLMQQSLATKDDRQYRCHFKGFGMYVELICVNEDSLCEK